MSRGTRARPGDVVWPDRRAALEGLADARCGRWTAVVVVLAVGWTVAGVGLANALEVSRLIEVERAWVSAGGRVLVAEPGSRSETAAVDAAACTRLRETEGVAGAFAVKTTDRAAQPRTAPGTRATLTRVSPGIFAFFDLEAPTGAAVLAAPTTVDPVGLRDGDSTVLDVLAFDGTSASVAGTAEIRVVASAVLPDEVTGTWLVPDLHHGPATSCYVAAEPGRLDAVRAYAADALAGPDGAPAVVRPRLTESAHGLELATAYGSRPLRWAATAGAALLTALWAATGWARRGRLAVYATFGAHRRALLVMQVAEWAALSVVGGVWGWALAVTGALALGGDAETVLVQVTMHAVATWSGATAAVVLLGLLPTGSLLDALKDGS